MTGAQAAIFFLGLDRQKSQESGGKHWKMLVLALTRARAGPR